MKRGTHTWITTSRRNVPNYPGASVIIRRPSDVWRQPRRADRRNPHNRVINPARIQLIRGARLINRTLDYNPRGLLGGTCSRLRRIRDFAGGGGASPTASGLGLRSRVSIYVSVLGSPFRSRFQFLIRSRFSIYVSVLGFGSRSLFWSRFPVSVSISAPIPVLVSFGR